MLWIILREIFFLKKSLYSPSGMIWSKMTIFTIPQPFLDRSFSSSNSTEILMRQFYVQNFSSIECNCEELSNKRTDGRTAGRTHWPILVVYSLFEYIKKLSFAFFLLYFICPVNTFTHLSFTRHFIYVSSPWKESLQSFDYAMRILIIYIFFFT